MKHIKSYNEAFSTIGGAVGKATGHVSKASTFLGNKIKGSFSKEDEKLGNEIYTYLESYDNESYNSDNEYRAWRVNKSNNNWYYFIAHIFDGQYKVEVIKHLDFKTKNVPEHAIHISKCELDDNQKYNRLSGREISVRDNDGGYSDKNLYFMNNFKKSERLNISDNLSKKIYDICQKIYKKYNNNSKSDAHRGLESERRKIRKSSWINKIFTKK